MSMENDGGMKFTGENRRTRRKTCPSATLSTTNPTWIDPDANLGLRGERPGTSRLSHARPHGSGYELREVSELTVTAIALYILPHDHIIGSYKVLFLGMTSSHCTSWSMRSWHEKSLWLDVKGR